MQRFEMTQLFAPLNIQGPDLLLRSYGQRAFPILEQTLIEVPQGQSLLLAFADISVMDTSFADETVLELAIRLVQGKYGEHWLILDQPSPATVDNLEGTIARRKAKVALLVLQEGRMRLIGHVEPNLVEAWQLVCEKGKLTARELADQLGLEINTASMRLRKLYNARLLARQEELTSDGRQHIYMLPA